MKSTERSPRRKRLLATLATASAFAGLFAINLPAHASPSGDGPRHEMKHGDHGPQAMGARMEKMVERVFGKVGASDEQKAKARDIVRAADAEMKKLHESRPDDHKEMLALLSADSIDRARIEQHRAARQAHMEQASKLMTRTVADLAEVLTPAQRKEAAKALAALGERHGHRGKHHLGNGPRPPEPLRG